MCHSTGGPMINRDEIKEAIKIFETKVAVRNMADDKLALTVLKLLDEGKIGELAGEDEINYICWENWNDNLLKSANFCNISSALLGKIGKPKNCLIICNGNGYITTKDKSVSYPVTICPKLNTSGKPKRSKEELKDIICSKLVMPKDALGNPINEKVLDLAEALAEE